MPKSADEARAQVGDLKQHGVDGIKAILDAGGGTTRYNRLDPQLLKAIGDAARQAGLPLVVHTGDSQDIADALDAGANGIEHGSMRDVVPAALFARMKQMGVSYDPTLTMIEGIQAFVQGSDGSVGSAAGATDGALGRACGHKRTAGLPLGANGFDARRVCGLSL